MTTSLSRLSYCAHAYLLPQDFAGAHLEVSPYCPDCWAEHELLLKEKFGEKPQQFNDPISVGFGNLIRAAIKRKGWYRDEAGYEDLEGSLRICLLEHRPQLEAVMGDDTRPIAAKLGYVKALLDNRIRDMQDPKRRTSEAREHVVVRGSVALDVLEAEASAKRTPFEEVYAKAEAATAPIIEAAQKQRKVHVYLPEEILTGRRFDDQATRDNVRSAFSKLSAECQQVLRLRHGFDAEFNFLAEDDSSLDGMVPREQVAKTLGMTPDRVRRLEETGKSELAVRLRPCFSGFGRSVGAARGRNGGRNGAQK